MRNFRPTHSHGAFAPKQWLYKKEATGRRAQKCIALVGAETVLTSAGPQTTPFHRGQYRVGKANIRKFGPTYWHSTALPQEECLYQKKAMGMASSKMYLL